MRASGYSPELNGGGAEVSCGNSVQESAHVDSALRSERFLELPLRLHPSIHPRPKPGFAGLSHPQLFASAITAALFDRDQAVAFLRESKTASCAARSAPAADHRTV